MTLDIELLKDKYHYREIYNDIIMNYGKAEIRIKYYLTQKYLNSEKEVCLYEFVVGNSRLDFGRINEDSYAYEIKTELDSLTRLENQLLDYREVFDCALVVIHEKHLKNVKTILPRTIGIILYYEYQTTVQFKTYREAKLNNHIKKTSQLNLLNSNDLKYVIKTNLYNVVLPLYKEERYKLIRKSFRKECLNEVFKEAIRERYFKKWAQIRENFDNLMPIEIQQVYTKMLNLRMIRS